MYKSVYKIHYKILSCNLETFSFPNPLGPGTSHAGGSAQTKEDAGPPDQGGGSIQHHTPVSSLVSKLLDPDLDLSLCWWIYNFLTSRPQMARVTPPL